MKRYDLLLVGGYGLRSSNEMVEQEGGEWVHFEDVEALKAENERLRKADNDWREAASGLLSNDGSRGIYSAEDVLASLGRLEELLARPRPEVLGWEEEDADAKCLELREEGEKNHG